MLSSNNNLLKMCLHYAKVSRMPDGMASNVVKNNDGSITIYRPSRNFARMDSYTRFYPSGKTVMYCADTNTTTSRDCCNCSECTRDPDNVRIKLFIFGIAIFIVVANDFSRAGIFVALVLVMACMRIG